MPVAAAGATPSQLELAIGPPGNLTTFYQFPFVCLLYFRDIRV